MNAIAYQTPAEQPRTIAPRRADLVECTRTGEVFLRYYTGGHYYWQPVEARTDLIPDTGVWQTGNAFHQRYWVNLGAVRRHGGSFVPVQRQYPDTLAS